jgi:hypothetical protein
MDMDMEVDFPNKNRSWEHELIQRVASRQGGTHIFELAGPGKSIRSIRSTGTVNTDRPACECLLFCLFLTFVLLLINRLTV